jgi:hypothetical protein
MAKPYISGLLYPQMKTERAETHLKQLQEVLAGFLANPYTDTEPDDEKRGLHIVRIALNTAPKTVPTLIGDYAYNLRSALDQLAWQLSLLSGRTPSRSSSFPIHTGDTTKDRERFMRCTWDIPCEAIEAIKLLQPYQRGKAFKSHPLWQLNKLCNLDKHATIGYSCTEAKFRFHTRGVPEPPVVPDYDTGVTQVLIPLVHQDDVKVELLPPEPVFGKPIEAPGATFELSQEQVAEIHRFIKNEVLDRFDRFFPMGSALWPPKVDGKPV